MNKLVFYFVMICFVLGCKAGIPDDVLQPKQMENVLFDMHIVDGYLNALPTGDSVKKVASSYYDGIYKKYGIDSATFVRSKDYYYGRSDLFKDMYQNIVDRLNKEREKQAKTNAVTEHAALKTNPADSIKKAKKRADSIAKVKTDSIAKQQKDSLGKKKLDVKDQKKRDSIAAKKRIDSIFKSKKIMQRRRSAQPN